MAEYIIIGGGISGLTAAYQLHQAGKEVLLLEASDHIGGNIHTVEKNGYVFESGPFSLRNENPFIEDLITSLHLTSQVQAPSTQLAKRYLVKDNKLRELSGPLSLLTTPLLSVSGKLAILSEPFQPKGTDKNESVASFFARRTGKESVQYLIDPLMRSTFAGDATQLAARFALPKLYQFEQEHGSLFKGMRKSRKSGTTWKRTLPRIFSFQHGLSTLPNAIKSQLGKRIQVNAPVLSVRRVQEAFEVNTLNETHQAQKIILALPAHSAASLLATFGNGTALSQYPYANVAVVVLAFNREDVSHSLEGFGFVAPSVEQRKFLGCIFSSSIFEGRAPKDQVLLSVLMGGANNSELLSLPQEELKALAFQEIQPLLGIKAEPTFSRITIWKPGIPQYTTHYEEVRNSIEHLELNNPGLHFLGNYLGGISIGSCIKNATELVRRLV